MEIIPVQKVNAVEQVYKQMQTLLIDGVWKNGEKLPSENELCEQFGVSRVTIRQAMQKLKALGLIETRTGSGSYVRTVDLDDSLQDLVPMMYIGKTSDKQVFQFREMIDSESVRIATQMATEDDFQALEKLLQEMQGAADANDRELFSEKDLAFHMTIVTITGNPLIIKTNQILHNVLSESMKTVIEKMKYSPGLNYHARILDAMKSRDAQLAEALMREHIRQNYKYFV